MKAAPWLLVAVLAGLLAFTQCGDSANVALAQAAEARADSLAAVERGLREAHDARDSLVRAMRDSLATERAARAAERAQAQQRTREAQRRGGEALDSARQLVSAEVGVYLDEHERQDAVMVAGFESQIASLVADTLSLTLALAEERALSEIRLAGWNASRAEVAELRPALDLLNQEVRRLNRQGRILKGAGAALVVYVAFDAVRGT